MVAGERGGRKRWTLHVHRDTTVRTRPAVTLERPISTKHSILCAAEHMVMTMVMDAFVFHVSLDTVLPWFSTNLLGCTVGVRLVIAMVACDDYCEMTE